MYLSFGVPFRFSDVLSICAAVNFFSLKGVLPGGLSNLLCNLFQIKSPVVSAGFWIEFFNKNLKAISC